MGLCGWVVFGFFAGLVARALMPGRQGLGFIATTLLGIAGSFVGGVMGSLLHGGTWHMLNRGFEPSGFVGAVIGAFVLLLIGSAMGRDNRR
jgi:uncharacterized membrane protein YeaQ/YmgE (transglycosylase-associated protein family)